MEDGLGGFERSVTKIPAKPVLILVLMEDGLGDHKISKRSTQLSSLNPCFNGGWSRRAATTAATTAIPDSLNPCFNGGWSRRLPEKDFKICSK